MPQASRRASTAPRLAAAPRSAPRARPTSSDDLWDWPPFAARVAAPNADDLARLVRQPEAAAAAAIADATEAAAAAGRGPHYVLRWLAEDARRVATGERPPPPNPPPPPPPPPPPQTGQPPSASPTGQQLKQQQLKQQQQQNNQLARQRQPNQRKGTPAASSARRRAHIIVNEPVPFPPPPTPPSGGSSSANTVTREPTPPRTPRIPSSASSPLKHLHKRGIGCPACLEKSARNRRMRKTRLAFIATAAAAAAADADAAPAPAPPPSRQPPPQPRAPRQTSLPSNGADFSVQAAAGQFCPPNPMQRPYTAWIDHRSFAPAPAPVRLSTPVYDKQTNAPVEAPEETWRDVFFRLHAPPSQPHIVLHGALRVARDPGASDPAQSVVTAAPLAAFKIELSENEAHDIHDQRCHDYLDDRVRMLQGQLAELSRKHQPLRDMVVARMRAEVEQQERLNDAIREEAQIHARLAYIARDKRGKARSAKKSIASGTRPVVRSRPCSLATNCGRRGSAQRHRITAERAPQPCQSPTSLIKNEPVENGVGNPRAQVAQSRAEGAACLLGPLGAVTGYSERAQLPLSSQPLQSQAVSRVLTLAAPHVPATSAGLFVPTMLTTASMPMSFSNGLGLDFVASHVTPTMAGNRVSPRVVPVCSTLSNAPENSSQIIEEGLCSIPVKLSDISVAGGLEGQDLRHEQMQTMDVDRAECSADNDSNHTDTGGLETDIDGDVEDDVNQRIRTRGICRREESSGLTEQNGKISKSAAMRPLGSSPFDLRCTAQSITTAQPTGDEIAPHQVLAALDNAVKGICPNAPIGEAIHQLTLLTHALGPVKALADCAIEQCATSLSDSREEFSRLNQALGRESGHCAPKFCQDGNESKQGSSR